jgi:hypothetical protein
MLMLCNLEGNYRLYMSSSEGQRKYAEYIIFIGTFSEKQLNGKQKRRSKDKEGPRERGCGDGRWLSLLLSA